MSRALPKLVVLAGLLASFLVSGCATTGGGQLTPDQVKAFITQVQSQCAAICAFVPAIADVAVLISGANPAVVNVAAISNAICQAVVVAKAQQGMRAVRRGTPFVVVVNNVPVHGTLQ